MESIYDKLVAWADSNGYWAQYLLNLCFNNEEISQEELDNTCVGAQEKLNVLYFANTCKQRHIVVAF